MNAQLRKTEKLEHFQWPDFIKIRDFWHDFTKSAIWPLRSGKTGRVWMVLLAVPGEVGVGYPGESKVVLLPENNKQTKTTQRELLGVSTRTPNS